jgi:hypothetical protein
MYETEQAPALVEQAVEYKPSRSQALRDYSINIEFLTIGCIVRVGCKAIPFTSVDEAMKELNAYVKDPVTSQKVWNKRFEDYDKQ